MKQGVKHMERSKFRSMSPIAVTWMIILLVVTRSVSRVSAQQNCKNASEGTLQNITGTYNPALFTASRFRSDKNFQYFKVWPENITHPRFRFFCQDATSELSLASFTQTCDQTTGRLDPRPYYDVGTADDLQPYYKHWRYSEIIPTTDVQLFCERSDMRRLYSRRVWKKTIIPGVVTTIVLLIILEAAAMLCGILLYYWTPKKFSLFHGAWNVLLARLGFEDTVADCAQLLLLVIAGFCMIEGVSHSSTMSWRSTCMLDAGVIYTYLTFFAVISSFLRQVACACSHVLADAGSASRNARVNVRSDSNQLTLVTEGSDWRWQRVFNQFAVVTLMTLFLSYTENKDGDALDDLVSVIWAVVVVAGTWSIGVSIVIGARAITVMIGLAGELWCPGYWKLRRRPLSP